MRLGTDLSHRVVRLADVHALIVLGHILDHQTSVLLQDLGPSNRNVTVFLFPQYLRMWIASNRTLELDPLAHQHRHIRRLVDKVGLHCEREKEEKIVKNELRFAGCETAFLTRLAARD